MELTRIIHPVGHGAFYTETFFDGKEYFNIVYDCGGSNKEIINKNINWYLDFLKQEQGCKVINAVFVSHLHADHINGLDYLLDNANVKFLFLPQLNFSQKIETYLYNIFITNSLATDANKLIFKLNDNGYNGVKIIKISNDESELKGTIEISEKGLDKYSQTSLKSGVKLYPKNFTDWLYVPYNSKINGDFKKFFINKLEELKNKFPNHKGLIDKIKDVSEKEEEHQQKESFIFFENLKELIKNIGINKIKKVYSEYFCKKNKHNSYSMPLFSGLQNTTYLHSNKQCYEYCKLCNCYKILCTELKNPNCLYTGDFIAKGNRNLSSFKKNYDRLWNTIETIQIPHHGSIYNHNPKLYSNINNAFVNVEKKDNYKNTLADIFKNGCKKIDVVTEDISTIKIYKYYKK